MMNQKIIKPTFSQELKKMTRQLRGSENIFGYKSTVANQLYLLYCFSGNIYFTDKIGKQVKFLWYIMILCQTLISYSIGLTYFRDILYASSKDIMTMFDVSSVFGCYQIIEFGFPLISYFYGDRIETMIDHVDTILSSERTVKSNLNQNEIIAHAKEKFRLFMGLHATFCLVYLSVSCFEVVLFFDEDKIKNYLYYAVPPPLIDEVESLEMYLIFNGVLASSYVLESLKVWSVLSIVLYWNIICCDQLISIRDDLGTNKMHDFTESQQSRKIWNAVFDHNVVDCVKRFQNIIILINYLRGFTEAIASFLTVAGFAFGVACLHVCVLSDLAFVLKVKYFTGYLCTGIVIFLFYWIGQNLNNSTTKLSIAVYSTPWYESVRIRKNVHLLLCQTQSMKDFEIIKVYKMLLNNCSKYLNGVFSLTNLLRKLTSN